MRVRRRAANPWDVWLYSSVDYGALELCALAQVEINLFGDSKMGEAINAGQDLHVRLAGRVKGITYEEAVSLKKAGDKSILDLRQAMKPVNFGLGGLMGPPKLVLTARKDDVRFCELAGLSKECGKNAKVTEYAVGTWGQKIPPTCEVCLDLAVQYRALWYEEWGLERYHEATKAQAKLAKRGEPLESFGTGMFRLDENPNAVSNHFFQNLAAQGAKHAGWLLAKESYTDRKSVLYNNYRTVVFVHDEAIGEVREPVASECAWRQSKIMIAGMKEFIPEVAITAEPALMRRWFKGAEKVTTKDGRLKAWWPVDKKCQWPKHYKADCACWKWPADQELMAEDLAA